MALKSRPADLVAFQRFAQERKNLLLSIDTSFGDQQEAKEVIARDFPTVDVMLSVKETDHLMLVVFLPDRSCLDALLKSDWLLAGRTSAT